MDLLQPTMIAALLVSGMGLALLGSVKLPLSRRLQIDEARMGGLVSLFGFVMIPVILTAGFLTDQAGASSEASISKPAVLLGGCLLMAVSLTVLAWARVYAAALLGVLLLSAAWATVINVGNVMTPAAFGGAGAYAFNLANVFFGLGAFLTPLAVALLLRRVSFGVSLSVLAVLCLIPVLLALGARDPSSARLGTDPGLAAVLGNPVMWMCGAALFFYGPLEASVAAWTTTYLQGHGVTETTAARFLSGFWLAYMASRLIAALTFPDDAKELLILALGVCAVVVMLAMVLCRDRQLALLLPVAAGFIFGPIFPTLIAVLTGRLPREVHGRAVGFFFAFGGLGWTFIPMLIGAYAQRHGVQKAFSIAVAVGVGLCASLITLLVFGSPTH